MRIIAGIAKGMVLAVPRGADVRPTSDRVRGAIFSSLGVRVVGATVLDLYAGTGALGFEAASRGAQAVTFVERSVETIQGNLARFQRNSGTTCAFLILRGDVMMHLKLMNRQFSLVFADPPYALDPTPLLQASRHVIAPGGTLVLEMSKRATLRLSSDGLLELDREAIYGDTRVCHLRAVAVRGH
jgi:16S rRNA (guanine966-N2)-methyltransferase